MKAEECDTCGAVNFPVFVCVCVCVCIYVYNASCEGGTDLLALGLLHLSTSTYSAAMTARPNNLTDRYLQSNRSCPPLRDLEYPGVLVCGREEGQPGGRGLD